MKKQVIQKHFYKIKKKLKKKLSNFDFIKRKRIIKDWHGLLKMTSAIIKKLAKRNLKTDKSRNILIIITIALAACLIMATTLYFFTFQRESLNDAVGRYQAVIVEQMRAMEWLIDFYSAFYSNR